MYISYKYHTKYYTKCLLCLVSFFVSRFCERKQHKIFLLWRFSTTVALASRSGTSLHMPLMTTVAGLAKRVGGFHLLVNFFRFGGEGNLEDWWSNNTATEFHSRAECLVRIYLLLSNIKYQTNIKQISNKYQTTNKQISNKFRVPFEIRVSG